MLVILTVLGAVLLLIGVAGLLVSQRQFDRMDAVKEGPVVAGLLPAPKVLGREEASARWAWDFDDSTRGVWQ